MPEGDTVYQTAQLQNAALAGRVLTGFDLRVPGFATADLTGETVHEVTARGKHLLHRIGEFTLHTHLAMEGSWRTYAPGEPWRRPAHQARAVLTTADVELAPFVDLAERMLRANKDRWVRSTTGDLRPGSTSWVYGRRGRACRRCGTRLRGGELGREQQERTVTWCPSRQT